MEKLKRRTGTNSACRENDAIPDFELLPNLNLKDAVTKRNYLLDFKKPLYGWASGIERSIERAITSLSETISNHVSERKNKDGK